MKQATKIWLLTAAAFVLAGAVLFIAVMTANAWDLSAIGSAKYVTAEIEISELFKNISIRSDTEDISLLPSEDGKCRVVFYEREKAEHTASVQDGTLSIETADTRKWYERIAIFPDLSAITVYLPQTEYGTLSIEEDTGDIVIPNDFSFDSIKITAGTGDVGCDASASEAVSIKTTTGDIRIADMTAGELGLTVSTGSVNVRSAACGGSISLTVSTGDALLTDVACRDLFSDGSTGMIMMENVTAEETITLKRSTGNIRFDHCDAAELDITTGTGNVNGSLLSEKVFIVKSGTGHIDIPETTTGGKCRITTSTGNITVSVP